MGQTLLISEKNKAAQTIARALGPVQKRSVRGVPVYAVPSRDLLVVPLRGHMKGYRNVGPYEKWSQTDPRAIITDPAAIDKRLNPGMQKYQRALRDLGQQCDQCIVGTDADLEGCNIGIIDALPEVTRVNPRVKVSHLWLHTLQPADIQRAYQNLIPPKYEWAEAAEARAILDAVVGFSATREVTMSLRPLLTNAGTKVLSIGRVQTSLLYLLFLRERGIRDFTPKPYWTVSAVVEVSSAGGATGRGEATGPGETTGRGEARGTGKATGTFKIKHEANPFWDEGQSKQVHARASQARRARVTSHQAKPKFKKPPAPLNTTRALLLLTKQLKVSSAVALKTMEDLYLNQLISYPRTDSDVYEAGFPHPQYLGELATHSKYGAFTQALLAKGRVTPTRGKVNAGDHSPITPVAVVEEDSPKLKSDLQRRAYDLLARHYLALFAEPAEELHGTTRFDLHGEPFRGACTALVQEGFLEILPEFRGKYVPVVSFQPGGEVPVQEVTRTAKETRPPPRFTDTSLIQLMERNRLGTKSSRPSMVEVLLKRGYVHKRGRAFHVTALGYALMESLEPIWKDFLLPNYTAGVEKDLQAIQAGKKTRQQVLATRKQEFLALFDEFRARKPQIKAHMQQASQQIRQQAQKHGKSYPVPVACPKCQQPHTVQLVRTRNRKRLIKCTNPACDFVLFLPKKGGPYVLKSKRCALCGFPPVRITRRSKGRRWSYYICPLCWNKGLKEHIPDLGFCSKCPEPDKGTCDVLKKN